MWTVGACQLSMVLTNKRCPFCLSRNFPSSFFRFFFFLNHIYNRGCRFSTKLSSLFANEVSWCVGPVAWILGSSLQFTAKNQGADSWLTTVDRKDGWMWRMKRWYTVETGLHLLSDLVLNWIWISVCEPMHFICEISKLLQKVYIICLFTDTYKIIKFIATNFPYLFKFWTVL